jgi:oligopeptidase B
MTPPVAKRVAHTTTIHNETRDDHYHWLRDKQNPEVIAHLEAENAYLAELMKPLEAVRETIYQEMRSRIKETDLEVPAKRDNYWYYSRTEEGQQYRIYCRRHGGPDGEEQVLLDLNKIVEQNGYAYLQLGIYDVSPDHRHLAYALDTDGSEHFELYFLDLETQQLLPHRVSDVTYGFAWAADNRHFFFLRMDETMRPDQIYRRALGDINETLIYQEPDATFSLDVAVSDSMQWLFLGSHSKITTEIRVIPTAQPLETPRVFAPRVRGIEYSLEHLPQHNAFLVLTNDQAENFKLMLAPISNSLEQNATRTDWNEFVPHSDAVLLDGMKVFHDHIVLRGREGGFSQLWVLELKTKTLRRVPTTEEAHTIYPSANLEFDATVFRYQYLSLVQPRQVLELNFATFARTLLKQDEVLGGYDPSQYESKSFEAVSHDGVRVPISLVYRKGILDNGPAPLLQYGYGSYGSSSNPTFNSARLSLLDRGVVFAIAHIRGGEEMGRAWYENGKLLKKKNTFLDFIACAEHLIKEGLTSSDRLAIYGGSAGGLLMGAVLNMRPELFKVALAAVPFVDCVNTMLDASLPLTTGEYDEWGNPNEPQFYEYIKSYSPYDNVAATSYPHILATTGLNDPRVAYWEPAKWVAKLRELKTDHNHVALYTNLGAGHGGASGRFDVLKERALEYTFILEKLGLLESK